MRKRRLSCLLACFMLLFSGCAVQSGTDDAYQTAIYYISRPTDGAPPHLSSELRNFGDIETDQHCNLVLEAMRAPSEIAHEPALPADVRIHSVTVAGDIAFLDISNEYLALDAADQSLVAASLSLSLLDVSGIDYVSIRCGGVSPPPFYDQYYTTDNVLIDLGLVAE